jgi:5'-3' exoribonuclease 1
MLGYTGYGLQGKVLSVDKNVEESIRVEFDEIHEPEMEHVKQRSAQHYKSVDDVAKELGISTNLISRITRNIYLLLSSSEKVKKSRKEKEVKPGVKKKVNVGLKFKKTKEEISGWSKRVDDEWFFSSDTIEILQRYIT